MEAFQEIEAYLYQQKFDFVSDDSEKSKKASIDDLVDEIRALDVIDMVLRIFVYNYLCHIFNILHIPYGSMEPSIRIDAQIYRFFINDYLEIRFFEDIVSTVSNREERIKMMAIQRQKVYKQLNEFSDENIHHCVKYHEGMWFQLESFVPIYAEWVKLFNPTTDFENANREENEKKLLALAEEIKKV